VLNTGVLGETALLRFSGLNHAVAAPTPVGVETQRTPAVLRSVSAGSLSFAGPPMRAGGSI
jgi:hypothetical protein